MAHPPQMELRRHYRRMPERDVDALVEILAALLVSRLERNPRSLPGRACVGTSPGPDDRAAIDMHAKEIQR